MHPKEVSTIENPEPVSLWKAEDLTQKHAQCRRAEATVFILQPSSQDSILDVGCGEGYQLSLVVSRSKQAVGLDTASDKLREGKRRLKKAEFIQASSEKLPFRPEVFDKVMCLELFEHLKDSTVTVDQINIVLRSEGILVASVPYKERIFMTRCIHCGQLTPHYGHIHSFDERKIARLLKNYRILHIQTLGTALSAHTLFSAFPRRIWGTLDNVLKNFPGVRPAWLIIKVRKP